MKRQQPERAEQRAILDLLQLVHAETWVLGTTRKQHKPCPRCGVLVPDYQGTMQTPGLPDIIASIPRLGHNGVINRVRVEIEAKAERGRLSAAQQCYRAHALSAGVAHLVGGVDAVLAWLRARGHRV